MVPSVKYCRSVQNRDKVSLHLTAFLCELSFRERRSYSMKQLVNDDIC